MKTKNDLSLVQKKDPVRSIKSWTTKMLAKKSSEKNETQKNAQDKHFNLDIIWRNWHSCKETNERVRRLSPCALCGMTFDDRNPIVIEYGLSVWCDDQNIIIAMNRVVYCANKHAQFKAVALKSNQNFSTHKQAKKWRDPTIGLFNVE